MYIFLVCINALFPSESHNLLRVPTFIIIKNEIKSFLAKLIIKDLFLSAFFSACHPFLYDFIDRTDCFLVQACQIQPRAVKFKMCLAGDIVVFLEDLDGNVFRPFVFF